MNHDAPRAISRWSSPEQRESFGRLKMLLLVCLRGNIFLYYGEELGLTQVDVPFEDLRDPEAIANWPLTLSRDGARTPMPWRATAPHLGFSTGKPWLPVGPDHAALAVDVQARDPHSMLAWTKAMLALRASHQALRTGAITFLDTDGDVLAFERTAGPDRLLCVFNLGDRPARFAPAEPGRWRPVASTGSITEWTFGPHAGLVAEWIQERE